MCFIFETHGFEPEPELTAFAETTCLFELWAPGRPIEAVRLSLSPSDPRQRCFRALLRVEIEGRESVPARRDRETEAGACTALHANAVALLAWSPSGSGPRPRSLSGGSDRIV